MQNSLLAKMFAKREMQLTLPISFAPNQAVSAPYGGGTTLTPQDRDGERSSCSSFSNLPEPEVVK